jgi:octaprenyl-diphosphate synthase
MPDLKQLILARVGDDLAAIEAALAENLTPYLDLVGEVAGHILFAGGKRLRPLLMVLAARLCGYAGSQDKKYATIFEYLHAATLLHDDLVDDGTLRRGRPVAHALYGNPTAVLVGDFLLARSLSIAAETGSPAVIGVIANITENMSQGEIHQLMRKGQLDLSREEYLEVIRRKTAVLLQGACRVGAMVAGAPKAHENALADYGHHIGLAFQMADDLLDYTADAGELGKTVGADLKEGKLTLPVIHTLARADAADRAWMAALIAGREVSPEDFERLLRLLERCGGLRETRRLAEDHVRRAQVALEIFPAGESRQVLHHIADYALQRRA